MIFTYTHLRERTFKMYEGDDDSDKGADEVEKLDIFFGMLDKEQLRETDSKEARMRFAGMSSRESLHGVPGAEIVVE